jgi:hypothetical protein
MAKREIYLGCFQDDPVRTMQLGNGGNFTTKDNCRALAQSGGRKYFGLQFEQGDGRIQCFLSDDLNQVKRIGPTNKCVISNDGQVLGTGYTNAVYELS